MWENTKQVLPLVSPKFHYQSGLMDCIQRSWLGNKWYKYLQSTDVSVDTHRNYLVVEELRKLLLPYKSVLDITNSPEQLRIFGAFFAYVFVGTPEEVTLNLAKIVVLLELHVNPNLRLGDCALSPRLWNVFDQKDVRLPLDTLNLLFSYGLTYENFLIERRSYLSSGGKLNDCFMQISENNRYIKIYTNLRDAYDHYKNQRYIEARFLYQQSCQLLGEASGQNDLSHIIKDNYEKRYNKAEVYLKICSAHVEKDKKQPVKIFSSVMFPSSEKDDEKSILTPSSGY